MFKKTDFADFHITLDPLFSVSICSASFSQLASWKARVCRCGWPRDTEPVRVIPA